MKTFVKHFTSIDAFLNICIYIFYFGGGWGGGSVYHLLMIFSLK